MALIKTLTNSAGYPVAYWRVAGTSETYRDREEVEDVTTTIHLVGFRDKASYRDGASQAMSIPPVVAKVEELLAHVRAPGAGGLKAGIYRYLKTLPEWADAADDA